MVDKLPFPQLAGEFIGFHPPTVGSMENQRKPTAPGTPHRSSVEQLQGLWHTLARRHSTKPLLKCWWECWNAGGQGTFVWKSQFQHLILTSYLDCFTVNLSGKLLLHTPPRPQLYNGTLTTRHAQMGPGKHTNQWMLLTFQPGPCSILSFRHLANTSALQCIWLYLATLFQKK